MKKILCVILAVLLFLPILTSCGNQKYFDSKFLKERMNEFKHLEPGIPRNRIYEVYNAKDKKIAKFEAGNTPILIDNGIIFYRYIYNLSDPGTFLPSERKIEVYFQNFKNKKIKKLSTVEHFVGFTKEHTSAFVDNKFYTIIYVKYQINTFPYLYCFDLQSGETTAVPLSKEEGYNCTLRYFDDKLFVYNAGKSEFNTYDLSLNKIDFKFPEFERVKGISSDKDYLYFLTNKSNIFEVVTVDKNGEVKNTEDVTDKIDMLFSSRFPLDNIVNYKKSNSLSQFIKTKDYFGFAFEFPSELLKGDEEIFNVKKEIADTVRQLSQYFDNAVFSSNGNLTLVNFETDEISVCPRLKGESTYTDIHSYKDKMLVYSFINYKDNDVPIKLHYLSFEDLK